MKISRERAILVTVLSVAGVGLLADRVIFSSDITGPTQSSAGVINGYAVDLAVPAQGLSVDPMNTSLLTDTPTSTLAERLRQVSERSQATDPAQGRDAFAPAQGWSVAVSQGSPDNGTKLAKRFQAGHRLNAVMVIGDQRCAVVDGQTVFVGQELDGYMLEAVYERSAVFHVGGFRVRIGINSGPPPS